MLERLELVRKDNDHSQRIMASNLNVSKSTYARWETNEKIIPLTHLNNFCNLYNVSMDYITGRSKKKNYNNIKEDELDIFLIANRIKLVRLEAGLTQKEFAEKINTTQSTICAYEKAKHLILTVFALDICRQNNLSLDWLCGRINNKKSE